MPACKSNPQAAIDINLNQVKNVIKFSSKDHRIILPNTNRLDIVAGNYYNKGYSNFSINIVANSS